MESHEWRERDAEGNRYYRGNFHADRWTILTTRQKRDPVWEIVQSPTVDVWRELRDLVWKKYQRKRCPWARVTDLDQLIENFEKLPPS